MISIGGLVSNKALSEDAGRSNSQLSERLLMRQSESNVRSELSRNSKRWLLFVVTATAIALLLVLAAAFVLAQRARTQAARYLRVVAPLRMGTTYGLVVTQLRNADIPVTLPSDCHEECILDIRFVNKWQYTLHLAPPTGLVGRLDFRDEKLVYKSTILGQGSIYAASVSEYPSAVSSVKLHQYKILVDLSPSDFTEYRKGAYAFNLACIGSVMGCKTDELLPTINDLEHATAK
jgi:hypothetical protein